MKQELIREIITMEWNMFFRVNNVGGKASCQMQPETFKLMRFSQLDVWDEPLLQSYLEDVKAAAQTDRNLMTEKYARMMEWTHPEEFLQIKDSLPSLDPEAVSLVDAIVDINLQWKADVDARYPRLATQGRPLRTRDEVGGYPSLETYMRSELRTYSVKTLRLLKEWTESRRDQGINDAELNLLSQMKGYGFDSLDAAERALERKC